MLGQTFAPADLATVGLLVVLEGLLSIDNALVLGVIVARLDPFVRRRALFYGLVGGILLRLICIAAATLLLRFLILKLLGGLYLIWICLEHFIKKKQERDRSVSNISLGGSLWPNIAVIELTDLAFALDSILAAVALVGPAPPGQTSWIHPKFWVIAVGGMIGIVLMRFAAAALARLMDRFPGLHRRAFLLVGLIGIKLLIDWAANSPAHPRRIDFQSLDAPFVWIFWGGAVVCVLVGVAPSGALGRSMRKS